MNNNWGYNKLTDDANVVLNQAIELSMEQGCNTIGAVHFFLALLNNSELGQKILERNNIDFQYLYNIYAQLASKGEYSINVLRDISDPSKQTLGSEIMYNRSIGNITDDRAPSDEEINSNPILRVTKEMINLIDALSSTQDHNFGIMSIFVVKQVSADQLMDGMLNILKSKQLDKFCEEAGISLDDISKTFKSAFTLPEDLASFVTDMNSDEKIKSETVAYSDEYVDKMFEILSRKLKSNPCLVGPAGVGKTSIVNRLVQRIVKSENVPVRLKNYHIVYINSSLLTADTMYRGQFEERMKRLLEWAEQKEVILFLDEFHTFINAGSNSNEADGAGNMIKKYLSDGTIKVIGATTTEEYHKFIEKDSAFDRRLQRVEVKEPDAQKTLNIVRSSIGDYEQYHGVVVSDDSLELAVKLSDRYIRDKYFPDKAFTVIDQACAKVQISDVVNVTESDVINVVSEITGINVEKLSKSQCKQILNLEKTIGKNLIGQKNAVSTVCNAIRRSKSGIHDPNRPLASLLFVGPTGVGKTELCKVLAKEIGLSKESFIKVDMSEFKEEYSISKLIGSAPGYVGYGEGNIFTEKVKHNPYSLVLFDEIEKAHPSVFNTMLQLLDEGRLTDSEGTTVDFTNCIIVMTSNAGYGADGMHKGSFGFGENKELDDPHRIEKIAFEALEQTFRPEFLNRLDNIVIFDKLTEEQTKEIAKLQLNKLADRIKEQDISLKFDRTLIDAITSRGYSDKYGARNIRREIQDTVEDKLSTALLSDDIKQGDLVTLKWKNNKLEIAR